MAADLASIAHAFVAALVSNAAAREAFSAAMHPPDHARAAAVVSEYANVDPPLQATDMTALLPLIASAVSAARAGGASGLSASIMPGDVGVGGTGGGLRGSIMTGDAGGASGSIMPADVDDKEPNT